MARNKRGLLTCLSRESSEVPGHELNQQTDGRARPTTLTSLPRTSATPLFDRGAFRSTPERFDAGRLFSFQNRQQHRISVTLGPFPPSVALDCLDTTVHVVARVLGPIFYGAQCACCAHAYPFVPSICESEKLITLKRGLDTVDRVRLPTLLATSLPKCSRAMGCRPAQSPSLRLAQLPYTTPDRVKNRYQYSTRAVPNQLPGFDSLSVESC